MIPLLVALIPWPTATVVARSFSKSAKAPISAKHHGSHAGNVQAESPLVKLLGKKIKHVFILYQENHSFDDYFGTFPGADGLYSQPDSKTPGFSQKYIGLDGSTQTLHPFRIGPDQYAADVDDVDHSHESIVNKIHIMNGVPQMDNYAMAEEMRHVKKGSLPTLKAMQYAELTMAHVDGDTIPILWRWADRFTLCDHIFQVITGPSTPGNISIFSAQTGMTQWMLHPDQASGKTPGAPGVPVENDLNPFWGSSKDKTSKMPYNPDDNPNHTPQVNLTYANVAVNLAGKNLEKVVKKDTDPEEDLADIRDDVAYLGRTDQKSIPWGWFEEGFDHEPTDVKSDDPLDAAGSHASYVTHHNGPQYFGYISNNPDMTSHIHGLNDFYEAIDHHGLPAEGVFYVKGGFENEMHMHPTCPNPKVQANFVGDDDHPGYSDAQISECMLANLVNHIAKSPYWKDSAIIITWDDSEGEYDHLPPNISSIGPDGKPVSDGARVPMIILSPFAKTHYIYHADGDQASVIKFVDAVFHRTPLAKLPDELKARKIGAAKGIKDAGPRDALTSHVTDLSGCFDLLRLEGRKSPVPAHYVEIPDYLEFNLPQAIHYGLKQLGIITTDRKLHITNEIPPDFNPRPSTEPTKVKK